MPELPEVEVTRLSLVNAIADATIVSVELGKPLRWPLGISPANLVGKRIKQVRRRGKYLLVDLDSGLLLIHLGMSGSLRFATHLGPPGPHDHFDLHTDRGLMRLHDPRRFGAVIWADDEQAQSAQKLLGHLGMEPLGDGFDYPAFLAGLKASRVSIKQWLLAGKIVVGVGNIYASEVLFLAGIRPTTPAQRLGPVRAKRLYGAIRHVLGEAIERGGSSLRDFAHIDGNQGHFQLKAKVYGRADQPCTQCHTPIQLLRQGQRSSYFCPHCQRF